MLKRLALAIGLGLLLMAFWHGVLYPYLGPVTKLHYAAGDSTGTLNFNLADVNTTTQINALPAGYLGLVRVGTCNGADSTFQTFVNAYSGNAKLWGFYLMEQPVVASCTLANLKAESDYIHANFAGIFTFVLMKNLGTDAAPNYGGYLTPATTDLDYVGINPYPVQTGFANGGFDTTIIAPAVTAAQATGFTAAQLIPVYQAIGNYPSTNWNLPTIAQTQSLLSVWAPLLPYPAFDYAYAYGQQSGDSVISTSPPLSFYYSVRNKSTPVIPSTGCTNSMNFTQACNSQYIGVL